MAVKLAKQGPMKRLNINLYGQETAETKFKEWQEAIKQTKSSLLTTEAIDQVPPPSMNMTEMELKLVHISSPSMFWTHFGKNVELQEDRLGEIIGKNLHRSEVVKSVKEVKCGNVYLAPYKEKKEVHHTYYRARVNSITNTGTVGVFFIDYGNVDFVPIQDLRVITVDIIRDFPDIVQTPGLALECSLANIQPSKIRNSKGLWDEEVIDWFKRRLTEDVCRVEGKIFSVIKSGSGHSKFVVIMESLEVTLENNVDVIDVKEELLSETLRFAQSTVESFLSQQDHRERMRFTAYNDAMKKHLDYKTTQKAPQLVAKEDKSKLIMKTPLSGPYSPLEHKILCVYRHGSGKMANIDKESVNTVMLDQAPSDPHDHWLVAAHVGINPGGDSLQLRNTSWLPARPGLGALSTMIFAPQVEVRHNAKRSRLTGFVAGLGPKTTWDKPEEEISKVERTLAFYPEHDMEVKFDINVNNQDINIVNKLRYWVNKMISKTEDGIMALTQPKNLDDAQKGIKRNLEELLERERNYEEKESLPSGREFRWNMLSPGIRLQSQLSDQEKFVYKMIDGVKMAATGNSKAVMEKLISLYSKADHMSLSPLPNTEVCPACPGQLKLTTPRDIYYHFNSDQHKQMESDLVQASEKGTSSYAGSVTSAL